MQTVRNIEIELAFFVKMVRGLVDEFEIKLIIFQHFILFIFYVIICFVTG